MSLKHQLYCALIITIWISGCKSSRIVSSQQTPLDSTVDSSAIASPIFITAKGDTLTSLEDEVMIGIHRLIKDTLHIVGVGDIMLGTNFPKESYLPPDSGKHLLAEATPYLKQADVTFGNLEGVILDEGGTQKYCKNPKLCYLFRSPEYLAQNLVSAGFDVFSTANNHAGDFGDTGRTNTSRVLDSLGFSHAGLQSHPHTSFMREGMKYGFAAFAPNSGTMSIHDIEGAKSIVAHLDSINDVVIVSFHGGAEGKKYQHVTRETETFYGENRGNVYEFAHELIDAGADVIFGHGPHVVRAIEIYQNRFIAYSLGNFCTYARFNLKAENSFAPIVKVTTTANGAFISGQIIPFIQVSPGGPKFDSSGKVISKIIELTNQDFPENKISLDEKGYFRVLTQ